jgi:phospholipid transport system transporter-binding protein
LKDRGTEAPTFEVLPDERSRVVGSLDLATVDTLLPVGSSAISRGQAAVIDLAGVTHSDSSGLALLIEWLSVAKAAQRTLRYENMPSQLHQLARLSEIEDLLAAG